MKRLLPFALVALLVLVPAGFVLAAKSAKANKSAETKAAHRSAKQKAANDKLIQELLQIMEETDNKMTFAACAECLTQLKPAREVVVPAIIRKADKMGWLKTEGSDDMQMIGEALMCFLPHKKNSQSTPNAYPVQMPAPACFALPAPPLPYPVQLLPAQAQMMPASYPQPTLCPPPLPCPLLPPPPPSWEPGVRHSAPMTCPVVPASTCAPTMPTDKMTAELLKIMEETESKVTFEVAVATLAVRDQNWEVVIPAILRKADKMGWLKANDKEFTNDLAELIGSKAKFVEKVTSPSCRIIFNGVSCGEPCERIMAEMVQFVDSGVAAGTPVGKSVAVTERILMPHTAELMPMPHRAAERVSMPRAEE